MINELGWISKVVRVLKYNLHKKFISVFGSLYLFIIYVRCSQNNFHLANMVDSHYGCKSTDWHGGNWAALAFQSWFPLM